MEIIFVLNRYALQPRNLIMMQPFKSALAIFSLLCIVACQTSTGNPPTTKKNAAKIMARKKEKTGYDGTLQPDSSVFKKHVQSLKKFAAANGYSTQYAMVIDLGLHSGAKRFFMVRLSDGKALHAGLVTHGSSPSVLQPGERAYSNVEGSLCSSLGRYKIGISYQGTFGLAYKMHGLDTSNNHAFARAVVLHSHECVPDIETEDAICQSWGCPTISPAFLQTISSYIDKSSRPVLMEIYDSNK
ncbi:MAG: murein L,D-transpeptidase catalytic domain family protein [Bacteroidota bacterium]